jgi:hypothetical protein
LDWLVAISSWKGGRCWQPATRGKQQHSFYAEMSLSSTTPSPRPRVFQLWHSQFWWKCQTWQFVSSILGSSILKNASCPSVNSLILKRHHIAIMKPPTWI